MRQNGERNSFFGYCCSFRSPSPIIFLNIFTRSLLLWAKCNDAHHTAPQSVEEENFVFFCTENQSASVTNSPAVIIFMRFVF